MKIYLGGAMFTLAEVEFNLRLAEKLRQKGFEVYCPNENSAINDKRRGDLTNLRIYQADIEELEDSNVFICQVTEDSGTMWEAGYMDCLAKHVNSTKYFGVIGLATDIRLATLPDPAKPGVDNQTAYLNQFVVGGIKSSLGIYTTVESMVTRLEEIIQAKTEVKDMDIGYRNLS